MGPCLVLKPLLHYWVERGELQVFRNILVRRKPSGRRCPRGNCAVESLSRGQEMALVFEMISVGPPVRGAAEHSIFRKSVGNVKVY